MLQNIRDNSQGTMAKIIIGIMIIPFIFFGVESIFSSSAEKNIAEVNGEEIPEFELLNGIELQKRRIQRQMGDNFDPDMFGDGFFKKSVTESLIQRKLFKQEAQRLGIVASDASVDKIIVADQSFHQDGKFSREMYEGILRSSGMLPSQYRQQLKTQIQLSQMGGGFQSSNFVTEKELAQLAQITDERRDVVFISVPAITDVESVAVSDEEINDYYGANSAQYMTEEMVAVDYLLLKLDDFFEPVSDEDLLAGYNEERAVFEGDSEWSVAHILLETNDDRSDAQAEEEALAVVARVNGGESFAAVAKELSDDSGSAESGGELGVIRKGDFPEFDDALSALEEGDISAPVVSESGVHILKMVSKVSQEFEAFDAVKDRLQRQIQVNQATPDYVANIDLLKDLSFGAEDLNAVAAEFGKDAVSTELFSASTVTGVLARSEVLRQIFDEDFQASGTAGEVLELDEESVLVLKAKAYQAPQAIQLAEVSEQIKSLLVDKKLAEATKARSERVLAQFKQGVPAEDIAKKEGLEWQAELAVKRRSIKLAPEIAAAAFTADDFVAGKSFTEALLSSGERAVLQVTNVKDGELRALKTQERNQLRTSYGSTKGQQDFEQFFAAVRAQSDIQIFD